MKLKDRLYDTLVRKNVNIRYEYERYVMENIDEHKEKRMEHWKVLYRLWVHYNIKKKNVPFLYPNLDMKEIVGKIPDQEKGTGAKKAAGAKNADRKAGDAHKKKNTNDPKLPYLNGAESRVGKWTAPIDLVRTLMNYDVISFDIFDTLLFRPFDKPEELFVILGDQLNTLGFENIRNSAERGLRNENEKKYGHREAPLYEIYKKIEEVTGLDAREGMEKEIELEEAFCFPNPYMKYVFETLLAAGKQIVLVSDMYIPGESMKKILSKCGYEGYDKLFISCDYSCSKRDGRLYEIVNDYLNDENKKRIHIGDNYTTDIETSEKYGFDTFYYPNVNKVGKPYRTDEIPGLTGSFYRGIANAHLHNGYKRYDVYYEFGYLYGGLFIAGYADYIHDYARKNNIDKVLFVARDGYIIKKVYDQLFSDIPSEYILNSRIPNLKMAAYKNKNYFIKEFVMRWINEKIEISILEVLENMELGEFKDKLSGYVNLDELLTITNSKRVLEFLNDNWKEITLEYEKKINLSKSYYANYFEGCKKALVVDIGWRGQAVLMLRNLEKDYWKFGCEITGMLAACAPTKENVGQLSSKVLDAYMFSPIKNISCYEFHSANCINNILTELLVGAPCPSFKGIEEDGDSYKLVFDVPETNNYETINKVHKGILDFVDHYYEHTKTVPAIREISGYDAYMPIKHIFKDYTLLKRFFGKYEFQDCVGGVMQYKSRTINDIFKKFNL